MSIIDFEHPINIPILIDGNILIIEHAGPYSYRVSINDYDYGLTSV